MSTIGKLRNRLSLSSWSNSFTRKNSVKNSQIRPSSVLLAPAAQAGGLDATSNNNASTTQLPPALTTKRSATASTKPSTSNLIALAATITRETEKLDKYMKEHGNPAPSFDVDAPMDFPKLPADMKIAREEIVRATKELGDLVTGPREGLRWMAWDVRH
jgi:hypothetical protein